MKKNLTLLFVFLCTIAYFTACSSDDNDGWKQLFEKGTYTGDNLVLTYGESALSGKQIVVSTADDQTLNLKLENIIPGDADATISGIKVNDLGEFTGTATTNGGSSVTCTGAVKDGILTIALTDVKMSTASLGGLNGTWSLYEKVNGDDGLENIYNAPFLLKWPAIEKQNKPGTDGEAIAQRGSVLVSHILSEVLNQITFHQDGNITAKYYSKLPFDANTATKWIMANGFTSDIIVSHEDWIDSPKANLAFWYTKNNKLYIVPNLNAILSQGSKSEASGSSIADILQKLQALGIELDAALIGQVTGWLTTGIPLNYEIESEGVLSIYVDKEMVDPFMKIINPMLPLLQDKLDEIAKTQPMISIALPFLFNINKLTDIEYIWNKNTKDFQLGIQLQK